MILPTLPAFPLALPLFIVYCLKIVFGSSSLKSHVCSFVSYPIETNAYIELFSWTLYSFYISCLDL